jgi:hypothetical protein
MRKACAELNDAVCTQTPGSGDIAARRLIIIAMNRHRISENAIVRMQKGPQQSRDQAF